MESTFQRQGRVERMRWAAAFSRPGASKAARGSERWKVWRRKLDAGIYCSQADLARGEGVPSGGDPWAAEGRGAGRELMGLPVSMGIVVVYCPVLHVVMPPGGDGVWFVVVWGGASSLQV